MVVGGNSYEHVSSSGWIPRQSCLNLRAYFCETFVCGVGRTAYFKKERWTHETNSSFAFWMLLPA